MVDILLYNRIDIIYLAALGVFKSESGYSGNSKYPDSDFQTSVQVWSGILNYRTGKATITFDDQKATKPSFFQYELESDEAENAKDYSYYTSKACHSSILRHRLFTHHVEEKHVFLFYEEFSYKFKDWNIEEHIASEEGISWGLAYQSSYVIQDGKQKLVNIRGSLEPLQSQKMKMSDVTDFMTFLRENVPANWTDRNLFLDYIANNTSWSDRVAKKLIRHSFLMDTPHERLRHVYIHCVIKSADFGDIDEEIAQLCPGLSSRVHEIFVIKDKFYIS
ncbi:hypothetical protein C1H46_041923 [Malus baccata]|uniref:Uncharacterized protein n=1 Tax=Malus baccata TaxID=106549 RepID=A0A540KEJ5_MALBA|nr:hypothetical protein C1H46_041923 [Malus baccata]